MAIIGSLTFIQYNTDCALLVILDIKSCDYHVIHIPSHAPTPAIGMFTYTVTFVQYNTDCALLVILDIKSCDYHVIHIPSHAPTPAIGMFTYTSLMDIILRVVKNASIPGFLKAHVDCQLLPIGESVCPGDIIRRYTFVAQQCIQNSYIE